MLGAADGDGRGGGADSQGCLSLNRTHANPAIRKLVQVPEYDQFAVILDGMEDDISRPPNKSQVGETGETHAHTAQQQQFQDVGLS